jgi:hypothetical protein
MGKNDMELLLLQWRSSSCLKGQGLILVERCPKTGGSIQRVAACTVGDGTSVLFWSDVWNGHLLQQKFPRLFSFAKNKNISVAQLLLNNHLEMQFHLPLLEQAFLEYQELQVIISSSQVDDEAKDSWHYAWGNSTFTSSRFYHYHFNSFQPPRPFILDLGFLLRK